MLSLTASELATEVKMTRAVHPGSFALVEGHDDGLFYESFTDPQQCKVIPSQGKRQVIEAIAILESAGIKGVLGVVDADFDRINGLSIPSSNIVATHCHDLEAMLIASPSLERLLRELGSGRKLERISNPAREILLGAASPVGALRLISMRDGLNLKFNGIKYGAFVNQETVQIDVSRLVKEVLDHSQKNELGQQLIEDQISGELAKSHQAWDLCCGDDLVGALSIGLRKVFGTRTASETRPETLRLALRLGFSESNLTDCPVGNALRTWQTNNHPYVVLR
jgi:hypothetical protein